MDVLLEEMVEEVASGIPPEVDIVVGTPSRRKGIF